MKVVDGKATDEVVLTGWSVGRYDDEGKLLYETDFMKSLCESRDDAER